MKKAKHLATYIFLALVNTSIAGWSTNAFPVTNVVRFLPEQRDVQAYKYTIVFTNYVAPFTNGTGGDEGVQRIITNVFYESITHPAITITNWHQASYAYSLRTITNTPAVYSITVSNNAPIITNAYMQARDVWAYESYEAALERSIIGCQQPTNPLFYRSSRENLQSIKSWLKSSIQYFYETNAIGLPVTSSTDFVQLTASNILTEINAPTNYLDYTPSRDLGGTNSFYLDVMDYTFVLAAEGTNTFTNTVVVPPSTTNDIVGTNGQIFTFTVTNNFIQSGYTKNDYGWKHITNIFARLTTTLVDSYLYGDSAIYKTRPSDFLVTDPYSTNYCGDINDPFTCTNVAAAASNALDLIFSDWDSIETNSVLVNSSSLDSLAYIGGDAYYNFDPDEGQIDMSASFLYYAGQTKPATLVCDFVPESLRPTPTNYYLYRPPQAAISNFQWNCNSSLAIDTDWSISDLSPTNYTSTLISGFTYQTNTWADDASSTIAGTNLMLVSSTALYTNSEPSTLEFDNCLAYDEFLVFGAGIDESAYAPSSFTVIEWDFKYK